MNVVKNLHRGFSAAASLTFGLIVSWALPAQASGDGASKNWLIQQKISDQTYNTKTRQLTARGTSMEGLLTVREANGKMLKMFWSKGAQNLSVSLDGKHVIDGHDFTDLTRRSSIRLSPKGKLVFIRSQPGRDNPVELVEDGEQIHAWEPGTTIRLVSYDARGLLYSQVNKTSGAMMFKRFAVVDGSGLDTSRAIDAGSAPDCIVLGAHNYQVNILLEAICAGSNTSKLYLLKPKGKPTVLAERSGDVFYARGLLAKHASDRKRDEIGILTVSGSSDALHFYHAVSAALLSNMGEPGSLASDEGGRQSWIQSYRTSALAMLYQKTGHAVFATLSLQAMRNTLDAQNGMTKVKDEANPSCGWASRIYSKDRIAPISLLVNQAMITQGLVRSCKALGSACPANLSAKIDKTAMCLAQHYEQNFDEALNLYRIQKDIPFRNDGIWAPWNWQTTWANLLNHAGIVSNNPTWNSRAQSIFEAFTDSFEASETGALMRYWPPRYYQGWAQKDAISKNRKRFTPQASERYEDINHGGISIMAACEYGLEGKWSIDAKRRLGSLLKQGMEPAKDMDGRGAKSTRWLPSVGWDCLGSQELRTLYTRRLSGGKGGPRQFTYTRLFRPEAPFELTLSLERCTGQACTAVKDWTFKSASDYLSHSPFFSIEQQVP